MAMMAMQATIEMPSRYQKASPTLPVETPTTIVSTSSASMSVITVPPTAMVTAWSRVMPSLLTMG